jgi:hypothetical protein
VNPRAIVPSQYGWPPGLVAGGVAGGAAASAPYTNTLIFDDVLADQFIFSGPSQTAAPSPLGSVPSSARITPYTRGLVPRPDPKNGPPILAIVGVPLNSASLGGVGASWSTQLNQRTVAQVNVLERARYLLP